MRASRAGSLMRRGAAAVGAFTMAACADADRGSTPDELALLTLSGSPTLEIGVLDGDAAYQFQQIVSTIRLPTGDIAVSDAGASEIAIYDSDGQAIRRFGGRGEGPGEFGALSRLYLHDDLILAYDIGRNQTSVFSPDGTYRGTRDLATLSQDTTFRLDVWLYGRFWVDGALEEAARAPVRAALDRLPSPAAAPGFRFVKVAEDGRLWVREPGAAPDGTHAWTILSREGEPVASIRMAERFAPLHIRADEVVGRWLGDADVQFVRVYDIEQAGGTVATPAWLASAPAAAAEPADEEAVRELVRGAIRQMASAQEIHYSRNYTYTTDVAALERWERPEGIEVAFITGDRRGWSAVFSHPGFDRVCGLGYGYSMPPGWIPGAVVCAPPRSVPESGTD